MTKEESIRVTAHIARIIAEKAPTVTYTPKDVKEARAAYSDEKLAELKAEGFYFDDFELFYVMLRFAEALDLWSRADQDYLQALFSQARKLDRSTFYRDPYLKEITVKERRIENFLLTESGYARGEFFQYDMPSLQGDLVVPKLGFFPQQVAFPAVYEGNVPWVSVCPSEIYSMGPDIPDAEGRVLVLGLGLGYYPHLISKSPKVKSVTIVERSPQIITLFREELLPQFSHKEKIRVVQADAFDFLKETEPGEYDFCYADIWEGWHDGADCYERILPHEKRLYDCTFRYWIHDEILWYQKNR
ncbi:MAG: class I SAM-dependent methyltransferase [Clostridia bacterium]|nr:class I SAM-dependent methyltransferase [Clostridia bacterium]